MVGSRKALLIATDVHADALFRGLRGTAGDAEALAGVLQDETIGGYAVRTSHNEQAHDVALAINDLFADARRGDVVLLYISGHGVKDDAGQLHLAMTNSRYDRLEATAVSARFIRDQMTRSRATHIVVWLDCCYAGAFPPGALHRAVAQDVDVVHRLSGRGRVVMTASSAMEYAYETTDHPDLVSTGGYDNSRGVFTQALVRGLRSGDADLDGDGVVDSDELYRYVFDEVEASPFQQTPRLDSQLQGKLVIATSARGPRVPDGLPAGVAQALDSPLPEVRLAALRHTVVQFESGSPVGQDQVRALLDGLLVDDDATVAEAAATEVRRLFAPPPVEEPAAPQSLDEPVHEDVQSAVDPPRKGRRRFAIPVAAAVLALSLVTAVVIILNRENAAGGQSADRGTTAPASPSTSTTTTDNRIPKATDLVFTAAVEPITGYRIGDSRIDGGVQNISIREITTGEMASRSAAWVAVYPKGGYDATEGKTGEAVTVAGKSGYYSPALTDEGTEQIPGGALHKPAVIVEYAPDSWYVVQTDDQIPVARDTVLKVGAAVRLGITRPMRFPTRFGYLPPTLHPCGGADGLDPARVNQEPWQAAIDLCDDRYGKRDQVFFEDGPAVNISFYQDRTNQEPNWTTQVNGHRAHVEDTSAALDCTDYILTIDVKPTHKDRYGKAELQKILENLTIQSLKTKPTWFDAPTALRP